jgi:mannose-1-phosphate guanylyltransferase
MKQANSINVAEVQGRQHKNLWTVILSGGNGERLEPFVRRLFGREKPKQYCAFIGTRTMLQHTLDRADLLGPPEQKVVVVAKSHVERGWVGRKHVRGGKLIVQPASRDTGPGVFLPLAYVRKQAPDASVVILPSDHYIHPENVFIQRIQNAFAATEALPERPILLGSVPEKPDSDLGWIEPGKALCFPPESAVCAVSRFVEKPGPDETERIMRAGGLLNTLVLVSRVNALWTLGRRYFPGTMALLEQAAEAFDTEAEEGALRSVYQQMPSWNFSADLLARSAANLAVTGIGGIRWSDWGRAERILDTLGRTGKPLPYRGDQWFELAQTFSTEVRNGENGSRSI